jgi:NADH dehydrogenase
VNFVAVRDVARLAVIAVTTPGLRGRVLDIGGPENLTQKQVASIYAHVSGREPKVRCVPAGVVRILATLMGPAHPGIARVMGASLAVEMVDQTFDPSALLAAHPMTLTRVEDVARERAGGRR